MTLAFCILNSIAAATPIAWLLESETLGTQVQSLVTTPWKIVHCGGGPDTCPGPLTGNVEDVAAVIGRADAVNLTILPNLKLAQSPTYFHTDGARVPSRAAIATSEWWPAHGNAQIAEWVIAAIFEQQYELNKRSAAFRECAFGSSAAAECDSASAATNHTMVSDLTIGVLGYGHIGKEVAQRAAALGATVVATKRSGPFVPTPPGLKWLSNDNDRLYREADIVVPCVPFSVTGLVNATALALMQPNAVLIPISAGPIDFGALATRLEAQPSFRAVLDLWPAGCWHYPNVTCGPPLGKSNWPATQSQLAHMPNVLPLPGMAMRDAHFWSAAAKNVAANLDRLSRGEALANVVRNATPTA